MTFLETIENAFRDEPHHVFLKECDDAGRTSNGAALAARVRDMRRALREHGVSPGDRVAIFARNSIEWAAADLGVMREGAIVVTLYSRQRTPEVVAMIRDASPALVLCETEDQRAALCTEWSSCPPVVRFDEIASSDENEPLEERTLSPDRPVAIFYTSGTSGEPKGVVLRTGNVTHVLACTTDRLDSLMRGCRERERAFHYLPFCFAGSWILLLSCLARRATLSLNADVSRIVDDLTSVKPHYFQNVPVLLDRMRDGVEQAIRRRGGFGRVLDQARRARASKRAGTRPSWTDTIGSVVAAKILFPIIRRKLGTDLRALICGSAPLSDETREFFAMIRLPVLQVYGLTETTAICTMDVPGAPAGSGVGVAIEGVEMRTSEEGEILVRGPNVFDGYWNRDAATADAFADGWFRTGDLGDRDDDGRWHIRGRIKNLLVPASGHNVAPEPIEDSLHGLLPSANQIVVLGNARPHLVALVTGPVDAAAVEDALTRLNETLPHYQKIRATLLRTEPLSIESGLVTANGKLRRDAIADHFSQELDRLYASNSARGTVEAPA